MTITSNVFVLRLNERLDVCLNKGIVAIGWAEATGLLSYRDQPPNWKEFKNTVCRAYPQIYDGHTRALGQAAGSIWRFMYKLSPGSLVLVPVPLGFLAAEVIGDFRYEESLRGEDAAFCRAVTWITKDAVPRTRLKNSLQRTMKSRQTCVAVSADDDDLELAETIRIAIDKPPTPWIDDVRHAASQRLRTCLVDDMNDRQLEALIQQLVEKSGGRSVYAPRQDRTPGDADVMAEFALGNGHLPSSTVRIAFQVKQHEGETGSYGVEQLISRIQAWEEKDQAIGGAYLVTTAERVTPEGERLADAHNITILKREDLIGWILSVGLDDF